MFHVRRPAAWRFSVVTGIVIALAGCPEAPELSVAITQPSADLHTRGEVTVQVVADGAPESVELLMDGAVLVRLVEPYSYRWDTSTTAEGIHRLAARAIRGEDSAASAEVRVTVDRTAPTLTSERPVRGTTRYALGLPIVLTFSESLLPSSVVPGSVAVVGSVSGSVSLPATLSADGRTLTLEVGNRLAVGEIVAVAVSNALVDLAGNPLVTNPAAWTWEVVAAWQSLGGGPVESGQYALAVGADGVPLVAFEAQLSGYPDVYDAVEVRRFNGTSWSLLSSALTGDGGINATSSPKLAFRGADSRPVVAYVVSAYPESLVYVQEYGMSEAWTDLAPPLPFRGGQAELTIDSAGRPVLAFSRSEADGGIQTRVEVRRWNGADWELLGGSPLGTSVSYSVGLTSAGGSPLVGYVDVEGGAIRPTVAQWQEGAGWQTLAAVPGVTFYPDIVGLAATGAGHPVIGLRSQSSPVSQVHRWTGTGWEGLGSPGHLAWPRAVAARAEAIVAATVDGGALSLHRREGDAWVAYVGTASNPEHVVRNAVVALGDGGTPVVSYTVGAVVSESADLHVKRPNQ